MTIHLVWFYGISTILGYLMPNQFYTYKQFYFQQYSLAVPFLFKLSKMFLFKLSKT